jgi:hypothetical protein
MMETFGSHPGKEKAKRHFNDTYLIIFQLVVAVGHSRADLFIARF